jgi:glycosyltransferase involved in cell wall biosynthesis
VLRNKIYYRVKPFVPQALRTAIRRELALRVRERVRNTWPIMPGSERQPEDWPGWPEGKKFALVLTHDVEGQAGLNKCRQLMQLEQELGFRSSFNFIPEGNYSVTRELRDELTANGFEIGVHDLRHDGRLYGSRREFNQNAVRINDYVREWGASGFRSGFMLHNLDWLHELEILYDASTFDTDPFEPQPEGRNTVFPFWVDGYGSRASAASTRGYVELPYTLPQDSTLFLLLREQTPEIWVRKLDWIAAHGGMVLLDTHPDYMAFNGGRRRATEYPVELYREFLEYVRSRYPNEYWHALPRDVARHFVGHRTQQSKAVDAASTGLSPKVRRLRGRRGAVVLFSHYPADPRPRRAAEALAAEGVTMDVICLRNEKDEKARETFGSVNVYRVPLKRHRAGKISYIGQYSAFLFISFAYLAFRSLTRRYDFVHVHNMPDVLVFSAAVPKLFGAKVILDLHDPMPELMQTIFKLPEQSLSVRILKRLEKWSIAFADAILTVNLACKKIYSARSCPAEKISVVLNSPDDAIFEFQPRHPATFNGAAHANGSNGSPNGVQQNGTAVQKPFVILYHGSLVRRNGFDLAVEALERVRQTVPGAKLAVCGQRTPFFEAVAESARQRGLGHHLEYLGVKNVNEIVEAINRCDLGIIPNHRNIFTEINTPTRIFEYLALGKPVVAPKAQGIQDYFGDHDLIYFDLGNADDLARKIEFAYANPGDVAETVVRGQEVYLAHTWSREKATLLNAISDLL